MNKPQPKDFGFDTKFQTWPDKAKRQKYRHAVSEYQKHLFAKSQEKDIEIDVLQVGQEQLAQTIVDLMTPLSELLAVMHGDGGHHQASVGTVQAVKDAFDMLHNKWVTTEHLKDINSVMQQNHNLKKPLESFVRWYWKEIDGKPYDITAEEIVRNFTKS